MKVPFTTADFLDRAEQCYPLRVGVVDEPAPFQDGGLGSVTYADLAGRARALAAGLTADEVMVFALPILMGAPTDLDDVVTAVEKVALTRG